MTDFYLDGLANTEGRPVRIYRRSESLACDLRTGKEATIGRDHPCDELSCSEHFSEIYIVENK